MSIAKMGGAVTRTFVVLAVLASVMASVLFVAQAASLQGMTLSLSDSGPGAGPVDYTFEWDSSGAAIQGVKIQFCQEASGVCTTPAADFDLTSASLGAGEFSAWSLAAATADTIELSFGTPSTASTDVSQVISGITNTGQTADSTATIFYARITTYSDAGLTPGNEVDGESVVASAVIPVISVTGTQDAILQMSINGVAEASPSVDAGSKALTGTTTATTLPFGNFVPLGITSPTPSSRALAQTVKVVTNGVTGYTATIQGGASAMTRSGSPSDTIGYVSGNPEWDESSTSGFGVAAEGGEAPSFAGAGDFDDDDDSTLDYEPIVSALTVSSSSVPTNGADTTVIFRVQVDATTPAGDYTGDVNYTVLPNF